MFFRMERLSDIYFVGGFGTVQWVDVGEYVAATPDQIVRSQPHQALQVMILSCLGHFTSPFPITTSQDRTWPFLMRQCTHAQVLNEKHSEGLRQALSRPKSIVDDAAFISIDRQGADVRVRRSNDYAVERMTFSTVRCWHEYTVADCLLCKRLTCPHFHDGTGFGSPLYQLSLPHPCLHVQCYVLI